MTRRKILRLLAVALLLALQLDLNAHAAHLARQNPPLDLTLAAPVTADTLAAARAWDAAVLHLNKEGEVLLANMDVVLEALQLVTDLHRALRRDELLAIMKRSQTTADDLVKALFDGDFPKSGYIPGKLYEEPK